MNPTSSRRNFLATTTGFAAGLAGLAHPIGAAAQSVGVKAGDLPDLTIKEIKVYVTDTTKIPNFRRLDGAETGELISVVTESGIEGNYTIGARNPTKGWLEWAKPTLVGKSIIDLLPTLTATSGMKGPFGFDAPGLRGSYATGKAPNDPGMGPAYSGMTTRGGGAWPNFYTAAADVCMWDILGKAVNRPIYKILSGGNPTNDRLMAYATSQLLPHIEDYVPDALQVKSLGYKGYKIHPAGAQHATGQPVPSYLGCIEEMRAVRQAVGDEFLLMCDPIMRYDRYEAMKVGRVLDELNFAWYEDPIKSTDEEGLIELCAALNLPILVGEFLYSIADFAEYIKHDALDVVRLIADNVGGISGSMRVGLLADAHGLECHPHNWGIIPDIAVAFQIELALPNSYWFEMAHPAEWADRPYYKDTIRVDKDGYVNAPTAPGLGYPIDHDVLDNLTVRIER
jgi:L-alanine-DL-glutamate epimerase-like enolase superfamily enzyme